MRSLLVSFFTPGFYAEVAAVHLLPSLSALNLPHDVKQVDDLGGWTAAGQYKPRFLSAMRQLHPGCNLLWVDVDAKIHADPFPYLESLDCDLGVHYFGQELLSGTVWLPAGPRGGELLDKWQAENQRQPKVWDQRTLQAVVNEFDVAKLPAEYCCIFDTMRRRHRGIVPVIEHFQASRELRKRRELV